MSQITPLAWSRMAWYLEGKIEGGLRRDQAVSLPVRTWNSRRRLLGVRTRRRSSGWSEEGVVGEGRKERTVMAEGSLGRSGPDGFGSQCSDVVLVGLGCSFSESEVSEGLESAEEEAEDGDDILVSLAVNSVLVMVWVGFPSIHVSR